MTDKEKDLLLKDLCARLSCGVEVYARYEPTGKWYNGRLEGIDLEDECCFTVQFYKPVPYTNHCNIKEIKPYLRPMSSMTEEEKAELKFLTTQDLSEFAEHITNGHGLTHDGLYMFDKLRQLDFCLSHHLDFRGLIPMGLAFEAKEGMYK